MHLLATSVLPSNGEWEYARTLIKFSEVLTEDEREEMRQQLNELEQECKTEGRNDRDEDDQALQQLDSLATSEADKQQNGASIRRSEDVDRESNPSMLPQAAHRRQDSQKDFGIEDPKPPTTSPQPVPKSSLKPATKSTQSQSTRTPPARSSNQAANSTSVYKRSAALISNLQLFITSLTQSASRNPMALLRFVLFLVGIVVALSRRDVKTKITQAWEKVQRTIGMGVKVSYI